MLGPSAVFDTEACTPHPAPCSRQCNAIPSNRIFEDPSWTAIKQQAKAQPTRTRLRHVYFPGVATTLYQGADVAQHLYWSSSRIYEQEIRSISLNAFPAATVFKDTLYMAHQGASTREARRDATVCNVRRLDPGPGQVDTRYPDSRRLDERRARAGRFQVTSFYLAHPGGGDCAKTISRIP